MNNCYNDCKLTIKTALNSFNNICFDCDIYYIQNVDYKNIRTRYEMLLNSINTLLEYITFNEK